MKKENGKEKNWGRRKERRAAAAASSRLGLFLSRLGHDGEHVDLQKKAIENPLCSRKRSYTREFHSGTTERLYDRQLILLILSNSRSLFPRQNPPTAKPDRHYIAILSDRKIHCHCHLLLLPINWLSTLTQCIVMKKKSKKNKKWKRMRWKIKTEKVHSMWW